MHKACPQCASRAEVATLGAVLAAVLVLVAACASPAAAPTAPAAVATQPASPTVVPAAPTTAPTATAAATPTAAPTTATPAPAPSPATKAVATSSSPATPSSDATKAGLGDYVFFPEVAIRLRQPTGFVVADSFSGFAQSETGASILAARIAGPYAEITAGFTAEVMKPRGMTFLSKQDITVDGSPGILVNFEQTAMGLDLVKWSVAFGDKQSTTMVTATLPKEREAELSPMLKACVLSVTVDRTVTPNPSALLGFTIAPSTKMKATQGVSGTIGFSKDGASATSPKDPFFIAARSLGTVTVANRQQFATQRLSQTATIKLESITSTKAITVGGLEGYESLAKATDSKSGTRVTVYQVVLFDSGAYYLMQGLVGDELSAEYLPEFSAMARSFRLK